jgi:hypothetical protein
MRERLLTLGCALAALFLFGTLFLRGDPFAARRAAPTSLEHADNGLLGAATWLRSEGVRTLSLRERFDALERLPGAAGRGSLLIVSLPAVTGFRADELAALDRWIRDGNTLLVLAALRDRPAWAQFPFVMRNDLQSLTGLGLETGAGQGERPTVTHLTAELGRPQLGTLVPNRAHAYFSGVARALGYSDYVPFDYQATLPRDGFALSLAHEAGSGRDAFWTRARGAGAIIVSGFGTLFSNRALGSADNARLLANLIAATVAPQGAVLFDDEHQGLSAAYDPSRFYSDPRLYATLAVIAVVWFTWVLGGTRLRMPSTRAPAPREAELVRTSGLFLARVLRPAAAARRMLEQFLRRVGAVAGRNSLDAEQLWAWLENHPRLLRAEVAQLRDWHAAACEQRHVPLGRLHNLIVRIERQLAA